ncbi:hypothetical protein DFH09DRAFT_1196772 [Mycena vulgaris]|nr:hypothetical protein DFH09DRAFT_1196772 [Mycena vulgaris]
MALLPAPMPQSPSPALREPRDVVLGVQGDPRLVITSASNEWLWGMIFTVKTIAASTEFIPLPYIKVALGSVVVFLETVDKIKKNREDLKALCASMVEITVILRDEIAAHGETGTRRFMGLCEKFVAFIRILQDGLEKLNRDRRGLRGRLKEVIGVTGVADQISRYRARLDELRSNFMLVATIDTNFNVADIQRTVRAIQNPQSIHGSHGAQFRYVALGDINLLYEPDEPRMNSGSQKSNMIFTARVTGVTSTMTVAKYEGEEEKWQKDLALYSRGRHPNISKSTGWQALIFYDGLVDATAVYRQFPRPASDLFEGRVVEGHACECPRCALCVEISPRGYSFIQFKQMSTICLVLTLSDDKWTYTGYYMFPPPPRRRRRTNFQRTCSHSQLRSALIVQLGFTEFYQTLVARWGGGPKVPFGVAAQFHLGSIVDEDSFRQFSILPDSSMSRLRTGALDQKSKLTEKYDVQRHRGWKRFTFPASSFDAGLNPKRMVLRAFVKLDGPKSANVFISSKTERRGLIDMISFQLSLDTAFDHVLRKGGTRVESHFFVGPINIKSHGGRHSLTLPKSDHYYWALDPEGRTKLSPEDADNFGLPRFQSDARQWGTLDVTQLLGLPVVQLESDAECEPRERIT